MLILVDQFGLIGILIAPPLAAVIQIFASQYFRSTTTATMPQLTQPISTLRVSLLEVQTTLAALSAPPPPEVANMVERLTQLIGRATQG
jgi:hypothetical protein